MDKKIKDTKIGEWLRDKSPDVLNLAGDLLPDAGILGIVKRIVYSDSSISPEDKIEFERLAAQTEQVAQQEVTKRWQADMSSDVSIAKVIRPSIMIALLVFFMVITIWDGVDPSFIPKDAYIDLLQVLMLTVFGAYFAGRTIEKTSKRST